MSCRAGLWQWIFGKPEVTVTTGLPEAAAKLEKAMAAIDPAGIKTLMEENAQLRKKMEEFAATVSSISQGAGVIVLRGNRIQVSVPDYRGAFRVDAWIDTDANWVLQNRELSYLAHQFSVNVDGIGFLDRAGLSARCNAALTAYLKNGNLSPSAQLTKIDLQDQLLTTGKHLLHFRVTPLKASANNDWFLRIRVEQLTGDGKNSSIIKESDFSSTQDPNHVMGQSLPPREALFSIMTSL